MSLSFGQKIFILILFLSLFLYWYYGDDYQQPKTAKNPDNSTYLDCPKDYLLINDTQMPGKVVCYRESGLGHTKLTIFAATAMAFAFMTAVLFHLDMENKNRSSVMQFCIDKYQTENRPIPLSPDIIKAKGFTCLQKGFDGIIMGYDNILVIARDEFISKTGRNYLLKGERQRVTPAYLFNEYLKKDRVLFRRFVGRDINELAGGQIIEKTKEFPELYIPKPLPYGTLRAFYSEKGGFGFGADRFAVIIPILFKIKHSIEVLKPGMKEDLQQLLKDGEDFVSSVGRTARQADDARRRDVTKDSRVQEREDEQRRRE